MIVVHADAGQSTLPSATLFCDALGIADNDRFLNIKNDEVIRRLSQFEGDIAIVLVHGLPSADTLREMSASTPSCPYIIRMALSTGNAVLRYSNDYREKVAEFRWPNASGLELEKLGDALRHSLLSHEVNDPVRLLDELNKYYSESLVSDDLVAAYLLKTVCTSQEYQSQLKRLQLNSKFRAYDLEDFLASLKGRIVERGS